MANSVKQFEISAFKHDEHFSKTDLLAVEEPLELRLLYHDSLMEEQVSKQIAVSMRTPGDDVSLAVGLLYTEGIISSINKIESIKHCEQGFEQTKKYNIIKVLLKANQTPDSDIADRNFMVYGSCGICGKKAIEDVFMQCSNLQHINTQISHQLLLTMPEKLRQSQTNFKYTGGIHACGFFDMQGNIQAIAEDIGRHNALDKLIGHALLQQKEISKSGIILSGRAGFEMIQKSARAGVALVLSLGAPSSLAVETAQSLGMTLVGFLKNDSFNIYTHSNRILFS